MTLKRINALRGLDHEQLCKLAVQQGILLPENPREWSPDRLRLRLIDSICDEELREQGMDDALGQGRR